MEPIKAELRAQLDAWMKAQGDRGEDTEMEALDHSVNKKGKKGGNPGAETPSPEPTEAGD